MPNRPTQASGTDWLTEPAAYELARRVRGYWQARGASGVEVWVAAVSIHRVRIFAVRSNIGPSGAPRRAAARGEAALLREQLAQAEATTAALQAQLVDLQASKQAASERARRAVAEAAELRHWLAMAGAGRPVDPGGNGQAIEDAIMANPDAPVRELAQRLGVSPSKVWRVRQRLEAEAREVAA